MNQLALPDQDFMYQALLDRNSQLDGIFYFGVKTTGIFCRPGCTARNPKRENVDYFGSIQSAMESGYRPCKICSPLEKSGQTPDWLKPLLNEIHSNPEDSFKDEDLRARNIEPTRLRRWFQKNHGITFHAYVKALRINRAFEKIKNRNDITSTAFDSGYESLSGFHAAFKSVAGVSPSQAKDRALINIAKLSTPLGPMYAGASEKGLCFLEFTDRKMIDQQIEQVQQRMKARFVQTMTPVLAAVESQLEEYFHARRRRFELPLDINGILMVQHFKFGPGRHYCRFPTVKPGLTNNRRCISAIPGQCGQLPAPMPKTILR
jgi:AraC family transcriptional regulator of adaptative response/methylated-DNA-[protein]-cysteine methyltransferase